MPYLKVTLYHHHPMQKTISEMNRSSRRQLTYIAVVLTISLVAAAGLWPYQGEE